MKLNYVPVLICSECRSSLLVQVDGEYLIYEHYTWPLCTCSLKDDKYRTKIPALEVEKIP